MKVSIIIPAYNVEKYISRCLKHSLAQSYSNIEILVVDDESTDGTVRIIKDYMKKDPRIKLLQQKHGGPNRARKKALDIATGKYVLFVDADDYLADDAVLVLVDKLLASSVKSIRFNAEYNRTGELVQPILKSNEKQKLIDHKEIIEYLFTTYYLNSLCFQIYETEFIRNLAAWNSDIDFGEDFALNLEFHRETKQILVISEVLYYYCDNPTSTTHNYEKKRRLKNLSDRVILSREAIESASCLADGMHFINKVNYAQLCMVKGAIQSLAIVPKYTRKTFLREIKQVLPEGSFKNVEPESLNKYIDTLSLGERIKNRIIINAIIKSDYHTIWRYIMVIKMRKLLKLDGVRT